MHWLEADLPDSKAVFSTRSAGSATDSLDPLAAALGISAESIVSGRQVHGTELACHEEAVADVPEVDGHVLLAPGPVGLVYAADCLPVIVAGSAGVAVLHCGWRGLATGIVAGGVEAVRATHAAIGPGIGPCCYEVGEDVLAAFAELGPGISSGRMLDLPEVTRRLLEESGVEQVESAGLCTHCEEKLFFSHRRDGGPGRQAGLAWIVDGQG